MVFYLDITESGAILGASAVPFNDSCRAYNVPAEFDPEKIAEWHYINGALVHDNRPAPQPDPMTDIVDRLDILDGAIAELAAILGGD